MRGRCAETSIPVINLEEGRPTGEEACRRLRFALRSTRAQGAVAIKLIHGYGSSGTGGVIKQRVGRELAAMKRKGELREVVPGEEFSPFYACARAAVDCCPGITRDRDYNRCNPGITVVIL